jgi:pimeloyl-ACP methyl ester carboxylesterase
MSTPAVPSGAANAPLQNAARARRRRVAWLVAFFLVVLAGIAADVLRYDLRSYAVLSRLLDEKSSGPLLWYETHPVTVEELQIPTASGSVRARLYLPAGVAHPPGVVTVHGIHRLGVDEPRLVSFARAVAGAGFAVLTPEMSALADYHVDAASITTIGDSAIWLDKRLGARPVTVTGVSFAGGLSLLAASNPRYAPHIRALVLMGAYDDLARVSRFLATSQEELPDGRSVPLPAHDYGASVFVYAHLEQFFPAADLPVARQALRYWLWEQPQKAREMFGQLSPEGRATLEALCERRIEAMRPRLLQAIQADRAELAAVSPHGKVANLQVPVFILHGSDDNVIPPSESRWLAKEIPRAQIRAVLITTAFSHVDPNRKSGWYEQVRLVRFLGAVLRAADAR